MRSAVILVALLSLAGCGNDSANNAASTVTPPAWCTAFSEAHSTFAASAAERDEIYNRIVDAMIQSKGGPTDILQLLDAARSAVTADRYEVIQDYGVETGKNVHCPALQQLLATDGE